MLSSFLGCRCQAFSGSLKIISRLGVVHAPPPPQRTPASIAYIMLLIAFCCAVTEGCTETVFFTYHTLNIERSRISKTLTKPCKLAIHQSSQATRPITKVQCSNADVQIVPSLAVHDISSVYSRFQSGRCCFTICSSLALFTALSS